MDSGEIKELLTALQERKEKLFKTFNNLADSGDNISAKGVKNQIGIIRKLIEKVYNGNIIIKEKKPQSPDIDLHKQRDILLDLVHTLYKELRDGGLEGDIELKDKFLTEVESKIQELESLQQKEKGEY